MDACEITQYIIDNNKVEEVLEGIGCFKIKKYSSEYRCGCDKYSNSTSIRVKKNLKVKIFSSETDLYGNIFTLIMDIKEVDFYESLKIAHKVLSIPFTYKPRDKKEVKVDILDIFKRVKKTKSNHIQKLEIHYEDICDEFVRLPYIEWVREGIMPYTQREFGVGYSRKSNRVILPHRYWCGSKHEYVGIIGRTLNKNYDILDIPKYFPLVSFPKSMNIYGINENYKHIQQAGYVNVFEAEKSTLKRHSLLDKTGASLGSHDLSDMQAKILISLDVDIIIQMDSDIKLEHIWSMCEQFYGIRNVYYVYDELGLLKNKESPADKPNKVYMALWNRKVKYDKEKHNCYIKYIKDKENR